MHQKWEVIMLSALDDVGLLTVQREVRHQCHHFKKKSILKEIHPGFTEMIPLERVTQAGQEQAIDGSTN
jgi:hypothetical protein